tara:strand:- start:92 stop:286 length:195 start_codon:yes stop_codon:yes gene_type:complete
MKLINQQIIEFSNGDMSLIIVKNEKKDLLFELRIRDKSDRYKHIGLLSKYEVVQFMKLQYKDLS